MRTVHHDDINPGKCYMQSGYHTAMSLIWGCHVQQGCAPPTGPWWWWVIPHHQWEPGSLIWMPALFCRSTLIYYEAVIQVSQCLPFHWFEQHSMLLSLHCYQLIQECYYTSSTRTVKKNEISNYLQSP